MATTLNIGGKKVKVDDSFNDLDAAGQQKVIRRIERDLGVSSRNPAKREEKGTTLKDVGRFALGQGLALGFGDEIEAGLTSAFTDESYSDAVNRIRGEMDAYRKDNAGKALAMELGGGLLTGGIGAGRAAAGAAARGAMGAIKSGALTGAGIGGVAGFGSGRDTLENRLTNAAIGAGAGGVLGAALPAAGGAIKSGVNRLRAATDTLSDAGVQRTADLKILQKLQQEGMTPTQALARLKQAQRDGVSDTMIADVGGESVRGLAQGATAVSGKARTLAEEALDTRQAKSGFEIADDVMGNLASGKSATQATEEIIERQSANAAGDYRRAFMELDQPKIVDSGFGDLVNSAGFKRAYLEARKLASYDDVTLPKFEDFAASASKKSRSDLEMQLNRLMAQNDITQRGLRTHREMLKTQSAETIRDASPSLALQKAAKLADEIDALPKLTFQQAHYIKMGMDAAIDTGKRRGSLSNVEQGKLTGLRQTFKERLFDENPAYKEANARFAGDAALRDAIDVGKKIFSGTADDLKPIVKNMSESEREAFRIGVAQAIRDRVSNQRDLANSAQDLFGKDRFRGLLREAFPDAKSFADFEKRMTARINQEVTRSRTKPSGGSKTAFAQEDAKDVVRDAELFTNLLSGNIGAVGRDVVTRGGGLGAKVGTRVAGDLFDTNLGNQREILRRLSQLRRGEKQRLRQSAQRAARVGGRAGAVSGLLTD